MFTSSHSLDSVFCGAIEIASPEERAAYIAGACGDDAELRREVEKLVAAHFRAGRFLERPTDDPTDATIDVPAGHLAGPHRPPPPALPIIPGYEILGELGRGGMGVVYKARQKSLNRVVALKMILAGEYAGGSMLERFRREAEAVARLCHPNIVQVYEVGEHDGRPFFSLEYVDGGTLEDKLRQRLPEPREAARLVETLAGAVHAVHLCNVVHRDLKPANVLLEAPRLQPGGLGTPKITDFGLAKQLDADAGQTASGLILGTPSYMAPEQAEGRVKDIGPACDTYALGAVLYECLSGRSPFRAATVQQTLRQVIHDEPLPPRRLNPSVPRDLETIALKCLQKEPRKRYATAQELADDLRRFLEGRPIVARRVPAWERVWKWARQRPAQAVAVVTLIVAVLFGLTGLALWGRLQKERADGLDERLSRLGEIGHQVRLAEEAERENRLADAKEHWDKARALAEAESRADEDLRARIAEGGDRVAARLNEVARQRKVADRVADFRALRLKVLRHQLSFIEQNREDDRAAVRQAAASALAQFGLTAADSPEKAAHCLDACAPYLPPDQSAAQLAEACCGVLFLWAEAEAPREALHLLDLAAAVGQAHNVAVLPTFYLRRARYLPPPTKPTSTLGLVLTTLDSGGRLLIAQAASESPFDLFLAALDAYGRGETARAAALAAQVCQREPKNPWAWYVRGMSCYREKRWGEAQLCLTSCLGEWPEFFWARLYRASAESELREFRAAEEDFAKVLEQTDDSLARWLALCNRGAMWGEQQQWDAALADLEDAARLRPDAPEPYISLAQVHAARKDYGAAVDALTRGLGHRADAGLYHTRAQLQTLRGDRKAAREDFERAIAAEPRNATERLRRASDYVELGHLMHLDREHRPALACYDAALQLVPDYPPAHRQRAETLLALDDYPRAGAALDRYLRRGRPTANDYQARGLIHEKLHEYAEAVEAYDRALQLGPDANTLAYRGWAYVKREAPRLALSDFEAALRLGPKNIDALSGRAYVRVRRDEVAGAVDDAAAALRHDPHNPHLLFRAAGIYAQAAGRLDAQWGARAWTAGPATQYQARAVELLAEVMRGVPEKERKAFWRDNIQDDKDLAPIKRSEGFLNLARSVER